MSSRLPIAIFVILSGAFVAGLWRMHDALPERMASHFDFYGNPNGWSTREQSVRWMALFGLGVPLLMLAVFHAIRLLPAKFINLPHREYWLSAERREETLAWIAGLGSWLACVLLILMGGMQWALVEANRSHPPRFNSAYAVLAITLEGACVLGLVVTLLVRFSKPPAPSSRNS